MIIGSVGSINTKKFNTFNIIHFILYLTQQHPDFSVSIFYLLIITNWDQAQVFQLMYSSPEYNNLQRGLLGCKLLNKMIKTGLFDAIFKTI
jgi:hypothetical protein